VEYHFSSALTLGAAGTSLANYVCFSFNIFNVEKENPYLYEKLYQMRQCP